MDLTIYNSYTAQACVLVILGLYQSLEYPVQLIIFWCWEWKQNHLAFKIHVFFFFSSVIHGSLKISIWFVYLIWRIDGLMDVKEECAKFGAVKGFKFTGDSNTGYKVTGRGRVKLQWGFNFHEPKGDHEAINNASYSCNG